MIIGLQALRVNPLRTLLSTLGVIMGGGALVSVLAMGDGVERFSHDQMARTTILLAVLASVSVGIGFGLYPALRAARMSPTDAIRHE